MSMLGEVEEDIYVAVVVGMASSGIWRCLICTSEVGFKVLNSCKALSAKTSSLSTHWFFKSR